jgi:hypothetical protein
MIGIDNKRWQEWCDAFLACEKTPMTGEQAATFARLVIIEQSDKEGRAAKAMEEDLGPFPAWRLFRQRADALGLKVTMPLAAFLVVFSVGPGDVVMWASALRRMQQRKDASDHAGEPLTLGDLASKDFAYGFPNPVELKRLWGLQKVKREDANVLGCSIVGPLMDNLLDYVSTDGKKVGFI